MYGDGVRWSKTECKTAEGVAQREAGLVVHDPESGCVRDGARYLFGAGKGCLPLSFSEPPITIIVVVEGQGAGVGYEARRDLEVIIKGSELVFQTETRLEVDMCGDIQRQFDGRFDEAKVIAVGDIEGRGYAGCDAAGVLVVKIF